MKRSTMTLKRPNSMRTRNAAMRARDFMTALALSSNSSTEVNAEALRRNNSGREMIADVIESCHVMCIICDEEIQTDHIGKLKVIGEELQSIIQVSELKKDGIKEKIAKQKPRFAHDECKIEYTDKRALKRYLKKASVSRLERQCIICMKSIPDNFEETQSKKPKGCRDKVCEIDPVRERLISIANRREDDVGCELIERVNANSSAVCHYSCYHSFTNKSSKLIAKRDAGPSTSRLNEIAESMQKIYKFMEDSNDCQFTMNDLLDAAGEYQPQVKTIKQHLRLRYGAENVAITPIKFSHTIVSLSTTANRLLAENLNAQMGRTAGEKKALVEEVAKVIRGDICQKYYDTTAYPSCHTFTDAAFNDLPETLQLLLQGIIMEGKKGSTPDLKMKCTAIGHAIISATRPRSFNSSVLLTVSSYFHRKSGSKIFIDQLSALGLGASYRDIDTLHRTAIPAHRTALAPQPSSSFIQFSFDSAGFSREGQILGIEDMRMFPENEDEEVLALEDL